MLNQSKTKRKSKFRSDYPKNFQFDYKDPVGLSKFIMEGGRIIPARISRLSLAQQKKLTLAIKKARVLSLLPNGFDAYNKRGKIAQISAKPFAIDIDKELFENNAQSKENLETTAHSAHSAHSVEDINQDNTGHSTENRERVGFQKDDTGRGTENREMAGFQKDNTGHSTENKEMAGFQKTESKKELFSASESSKRELKGSFESKNSDGKVTAADSQAISDTKAQPEQDPEQNKIERE